MIKTAEYTHYVEYIYPAKDGPVQVRILTAAEALKLGYYDNYRYELPDGSDLYVDGAEGLAEAKKLCKVVA